MKIETQGTREGRSRNINTPPTQTHTHTLKNEDGLKNEQDPKNEEDPKMRRTLETETNSKMKKTKK